MLTNEKMLSFLECAEGWQSLALPEELRSVNQVDFVHARGCILVRQVMCSNHEAFCDDFNDVDFDDWQDDAKKQFVDRTGYEAAEHLHLEDVGIVANQLAYALAFANVVFTDFRAKYHHLVLRAIISNEVDPEFGASCTVRFHIRRPCENWVAMTEDGNLADCPINGVLVVDSDDELMNA